jgi:hypothetical protein
MWTKEFHCGIASPREWHKDLKLPDQAQFSEQNLFAGDKWLHEVKSKGKHREQLKQMQLRLPTLKNNVFAVDKVSCS